MKPPAKAAGVLNVRRVVYQQLYGDLFVHRELCREITAGGVTVVISCIEHDAGMLGSHSKGSVSAEKGGRERQVMEGERLRLRGRRKRRVVTEPQQVWAYKG